MRSFLIAFVMLLPAYLHAQTPSRLTDGRIEFAIGKVFDQVVWNEREKSDLIASFVISPSTPVIVFSPLVPENYEINLSTCIRQFENHSDFLACQTKKGLRKKLKGLRDSLQDSQDVGDNLAVRDFKERLEWIKSYGKGLPNE